MNFKPIKNIIFDLGGVIINIDFQPTYEAFSKLAETDILTIVRKFEELKVFKKFEAGEFTETEFREYLRNNLKSYITNSQIDSAWNALLKDIPVERIELLIKLSKKYRIFLLSNTNSIHIREVEKIFEKSSGGLKMIDLFEKIYYSYEIKLSKPGVEIYEYVLRDKNLKPEETIFLDDSADNCNGAESAGIKSLRVGNPESILELLKDA